MSLHPPPPSQCAQARLARDPRFDGVFFTAVRTTGIYCRPVCPVPPAAERNVEYHASAAQAEAAGYRPCMRCRPELSPSEGSWRRGDALVARALRMIEGGALDEASVDDLARRLHVGERHLRRLFMDTLGTTPQQVRATRRLLFAKQLLTETALPVTQVATACGFASLRRFNDAFVRAYAMPPTALRRQAAGDVAPGPLVLRLGYRPPFDFAATLAFLRTRMLPGIERVDAHGYARVVDAGGAWLRVEPWGGGIDALRLSLHGVAARELAALVRQVRAMFDLDADPQVIAATLADDALLAPLLQARPGLRLPGGWSGEEVAMRAVLGQQVSVAAATTFARRLVQRHGLRLASPAGDGLDALFPAMATLASADLRDIGLPAARARTLSTVAAALRDGTVHFSPAKPLEDFVAAWTALPGIGDWTAQYVALRGLHHPDAFPAGDLVLRQQVGGGSPVGERQLRELAGHWRPWRGYAVIHLWQSATRQAAAQRSNAT